MNSVAPTSARALLVAALALALAGCAPAESEPPAAFDGSHVGVEAWAAAAEQPGVVVLDVRTPEEFAEGHIDGAVLVNLNSGQFDTEVATLNPSLEYAVYCRSGNRSRAAINVMTALGFNSTVGLEGGISAWTSSGRETVAP